MLEMDVHLNLLFQIQYQVLPDGKSIQQGNEFLPITYKASLIHDVCYQFKKEIPLTRYEVDKLFYSVLKTYNFKLAKIYYIAVRCFG